MTKRDTVMPEDSKVLSHIDSGKHLEALETLLVGYQMAILRYCTAMLGSAEDAEDVAQEVFIAAYRAMPQFRGNAAISTWLFHIARHKCHQMLRNQSRRQRLTTQEQRMIESHTHGSSSSPEEQKREEALRLLPEILQKFPATEREILLLRFQQSLTYAEIAHILRMSERTVARRWRRVLSTRLKVF